MAGLVYGLCMIASLGCAFLLLRNYFKTKHRLILWSGLCFVGFSLNNFLLVIDYLTPRSLDLSTIRVIPALIGTLLLIYGLIFEDR